MTNTFHIELNIRKDQNRPHLFRKKGLEVRSYSYHRFFYLGLAVIINRINKSNITVGVDGSLYRYHPRFKRNMEKCMKTLVNKNIKVCRNINH